MSVCPSEGIDQSTVEWVGVLGLWNRVKEADSSDWTSSMPRRRVVLGLSCIYNNYE